MPIPEEPGCIQQPLHGSFGFESSTSPLSADTLPDPMTSAEPQISVIVPVFNEEESLPILNEELFEHLGRTRRSFEILYVDDRSTDGSYEILSGFQAADERVRVLRFRRNFGQTAAMSAGFEHSRGELVITLDADLQNDPVDIPALIEELETGYDLVAGWRKDRKDGWLLRRLPSIVANRMIAWWTGAKVHDTGCTLKVFRAALVRNLPIYAEQHRFLPVLAQASGARIGELVVNHRPRRFGSSKYGIGRAIRVLVDLLTVKMLSSFSRKPLQYFALLSMPFLAAFVWVLATTQTNFGNLAGGKGFGPQSMLTMMLLVGTGAFFLILGLLAELVVKTSDMHGKQRFTPLMRGPWG
ncbi:MAG: glycosyltransferase involved in cell wall biosynthesis [Planctomycetota bacterium]